MMMNSILSTNKLISPASSFPSSSSSHRLSLPRTSVMIPKLPTTSASFPKLSVTTPFLRSTTMLRSATDDSSEPAKEQDSTPATDSTKKDVEAKKQIKAFLASLKPNLLFLGLLFLKYAANLVNELYSSVFVNDVMKLKPDLSIWQFLLKVYKLSRAKAIGYVILLACLGTFINWLPNI